MQGLGWWHRWYLTRLLSNGCWDWWSWIDVCACWSQVKASFPAELGSLSTEAIRLRKYHTTSGELTDQAGASACVCPALSRPDMQPFLV